MPLVPTTTVRECLRRRTEVSIGSALRGARNRIAAGHPPGAPQTSFCLGRLHADLVPCVGDGLLVGAAGAVAALGVGRGAPGKGGETRRPPQVPVPRAVVP